MTARESAATRPASPAKITKARIGVYTAILSAVWTAYIVFSLMWAIRAENAATIEIARDNAAAILEKDQVYRRWAAIHGGVYVPVSEDTPPSPFLADVPERDVITPSGRRLTLLYPEDAINYTPSQVQFGNEAISSVAPLPQTSRDSMDSRDNRDREDRG